MSRDAEARSPTVTYHDGEPKFIELTATRWSGDNRYDPVYKFRMEGSTAVLTMITPDGERYNVLANDGTREAAAEAVDELPFVQAVQMLGGGDK